MAKISAVCLLTVLAVGMAAGANAQPVTCTTFEDSPTKAVALKAVDYLRTQRTCCQNNFGGNYCSELYKLDEGRLLLCGEPGRCTRGDYLSNFLMELLNICTADFSGTARCAGSYESFTFGVRIVIQPPFESTHGVGNPIDGENLRTSV